MLKLELKSSISFSFCAYAERLSNPVKNAITGNKTNFPLVPISIYSFGGNA
jgi:hypothetical protein